MKLYKESWYPKKKIEIPKENIVSILTLNERSSIGQGCYNNDFERQGVYSFAVNYAWRKRDRSSVLRRFEIDDKLYEIDSQKKRLLIQPTFGQLFYDRDKIEKSEFVFEGSLNEFIKTGYQIKDKYES